MGLDNGIIVHSDYREITRDMLPEEIVYPFERDYSTGVEIVYWRKNWGLRNAVLDAIAKGFNDEAHGTYTIETPSEVFKIIKIITSFMDKDWWEDEGDSIWDYDEILPILQQNIINLALIASFMKNNPDVYLLFYDSY